LKSLVTFVFLLTAANPETISALPLSTHYVTTDGNCGSASPCYSSIQDAIDAASSDDEIRVAAGDYTQITTVGILKQVAYITKSLTIKGGYTSTDWENQDPISNVVNLNAQTQGRVVYIQGPDISVDLNGLTMSYGKANGQGGGSSGGDVGGGMYMHWMPQ